MGERFFMKDSGKKLLLLIGGGFLAGIANGLLGAGGGIVAVFVLTKLLKDTEADSRDVFASALCVMLPLSVISTVSYLLRGDISLDGFGVYLIPAIAGGVVGGFVLGKINVTLLRTLFSGIMVYSGISLMVK